ncbi:MAG: 50S ribosomal protein L4 [Candidatus Sumerlaeia bacterium]|nr:50S ribosomal protein L4 [Candidatus Sumerlaeia bacterium]
MMTTIKTYTLDGKESGTIPAAEEVFNAPQNEIVVREAANAYRSNQRQGTHMTKNRALVSGGGKKPWKQKGTGRARAGSIRSPLWRGGGTMFGPQPRDYREKVNTKKRRAAFRAMLSNRAQLGLIRVIPSFSFGADLKTKNVHNFLVAQGVASSRVVFVTATLDADLLRITRNIPFLVVTTADNLNINDLILSDVIFTTAEGIEKLIERAHPDRDQRVLTLESDAAKAAN